MSFRINCLYSVLQKKALKYKNQLDAHIEEDIADTIETKASLKFINVSLQSFRR